MFITWPILCCQLSEVVVARFQGIGSTRQTIHWSPGTAVGDAFLEAVEAIGGLQNTTPSDILATMGSREQDVTWGCVLETAGGLDRLPERIAHGSCP